MKAKEKSRRMLRLLSGACMSKVLFTDEKTFNVEPLHNRQNRRQLLKKAQQKTVFVKTIGRSHFPSSVMVWARICATGKTPLIFIDRNVKINAVSNWSSVTYRSRGDGALRPRIICASIGLGVGSFSPFDNRCLRKAVSRLLG